MDSGAPETSKRAGSRSGGGGVIKPPAKGVSTKSNGTGAARPGPVDPRTEDPSSPQGLSRAGKTVWRRPGAQTPRSAEQQAARSIDAPIDFSATLPLAPDAPATPVAKVADPQPIALPRSFETLPPTAPAPVFVPTNLVPTTVHPVTVDPAGVAATGLVPTALVPSELRTVPVPVPAAILYDEAATIDDVTRIGPILDTRPLRRPITFRRAPKPRIRRVTRVVRHVDTWSVFKVALVFSVFLYAVALVAGVLLWQVAYATGTIDNVEKFFEGFGWETFNFNGGQIFHNAWIAGLFLAVGVTGLAVLMATLFNLITDLVGGVRFSVLEEEVQTRAERGTEQVVSDRRPVLVDDEDAFDADTFEPGTGNPTVDGQGDHETSVVASDDAAIAG
ncbi:MAG: DUF3566 domain-containing protein [Ilumatobacteraceae bacterium]